MLSSHLPSVACYLLYKPIQEEKSDAMRKLRKFLLHDGNLSLDVLGYAKKSYD